MRGGALRVTVSLILVLSVLAAFLWKRWQEPSPGEPVDRNPAVLDYSSFARCRQACLRLKESDLREVMQTGVRIIDRYSRTVSNGRRFTLQGKTGRGTYLRLRLLQNKATTTIESIEAISGRDQCHCDGYSMN